MVRLSFTNRVLRDSSGQDLPGRWLTRSEALLKYRLIFLRYYLLFGDDGKINGWLITKILRRIPILRQITRTVGTTLMRVWRKPDPADSKVVKRHTKGI